MANLNTLQVAFIQSNLVWENPLANRHNFEEKINAINSKIDLIILPEMFSTGFTMNAKKVAESMSGETILWMQKMASKKNCALVGSIIVVENTNFYNRLLFVHPSGKIDFYDKKHTFTLAGEGAVFTQGEKKLIVSFKGWKICSLICYDLRFPAWCRNTHTYDLLLFVASWPKQRISAWNTLLKARAIENMSYTIGVNRVGEDANKYQYTGHSACYDALGNCMAKDTEKEAVLIVEINKGNQQKIREKLNFLADRDSFTFQ